MVSIVTFQILRISEPLAKVVTIVNAKPGKTVETGENLTKTIETWNCFVKKCKSFCNFL